MKLTKSKLKELIKETLIKINEEELRDSASKYDKRSAIDQYIGQLSIDSRRNYNRLMGDLRELFGWEELLRMINEWTMTDHEYYEQLAAFVNEYGLGEIEEKEVEDDVDNDYGGAVLEVEPEEPEEEAEPEAEVEDEEEPEEEED